MKTTIILLLISCSVFGQKTKIDSILLYEHKGRIVEKEKINYDIVNDTIYVSAIQDVVYNRKKIAYFMPILTRKDLIAFKKTFPKVKIPQRILDKIK